MRTLGSIDRSVFSFTCGIDLHLPVSETLENSLESYCCEHVRDYKLLIMILRGVNGQRTCIQPAPPAERSIHS